MRLTHNEYQELARLRALVAGRTNGAGEPKAGYKTNVAMIRQRITDLEHKDAPAWRVTVTANIPHGTHANEVYFTGTSAEMAARQYADLARSLPTTLDVRVERV